MIVWEASTESHRILYLVLQGELLSSGARMWLCGTRRLICKRHAWELRHFPRPQQWRSDGCFGSDCMQHIIQSQIICIDFALEILISLNRFFGGGDVLHPGSACYCGEMVILGHQDWLGASHQMFALIRSGGRRRGGERDSSVMWDNSL